MESTTVGNKKTRQNGRTRRYTGVLGCTTFERNNCKAIELFIPGLREVIDRLGNFQWVTILDLANSYQQFEVVEEDREKTAFTWDGIQWMFCRVPYGLK